MRPDDLVHIRKEQLRCTQAELAAKLGVSLPTVHRLETKPGAISLRDQLAIERLQEIQPPRRLYLLDLQERNVIACTRSMADAYRGIPVFQDSLVTIYLACPDGHCPWPVPMRLQGT